ncbi:hypothetical protein F5B18DRAFT_206930 [Nemania serpens]|nr:hypothetical protein F5B18DRAFT_206930 [Nemania serpens]
MYSVLRTYLLSLPLSSLPSGLPNRNSTTRSTQYPATWIQIQAPSPPSGPRSPKPPPQRRMLLQPHDQSHRSPFPAAFSPARRSKSTVHVPIKTR